MNEDENIDKDEYNLLHIMRHMPDYGERRLYSKMFEALNLEENEKGIFWEETRLAYFETDKYVFEESLLSRRSEFPEITGDQRKKAEAIYDELINAKERYPIHEAGHGIAALILGKLCFINLDERRTVVYDSWTDVHRLAAVATAWASTRRGCYLAFSCSSTVPNWEVLR